MRIIIPHQITEPQLVASNIPETDAPAWASGTAYTVDAKVIRGHAVYQAAQASTGQDPATDTSETYWVNIGATNRWRAFDSVISGGQVIGVGATITYQLRLSRTLDSIAFFNLDATSVRVRARIVGASADFMDVTHSLAARDDVTNFWGYIYNEFTFTPDLVLADLLLPSGCDVYITITAGAVAQVSEIILGRAVRIGDVRTGTSLGIVDYSLKERDPWGRLVVTQRPVTTTVNFVVRIDSQSAAWLHKTMKSVASKVCVFFEDDGTDDFGTTIVGILRDYDLTIAARRSSMTLEVESLA